MLLLCLDSPVKFITKLCFPYRINPPTEDSPLNHPAYEKGRGAYKNLVGNLQKRPQLKDLGVDEIIV
jgi:hypothetical protein